VIFAPTDPNENTLFGFTTLSTFCEEMAATFAHSN
jgi:hypothetical protein